MNSQSKHRPASIRARRKTLAVGAILAAAAGAALSAPPPGSLRFEQAFATKGEPSALHYRATYTVRGTEHRLQVWRDGDRRLVRRTDDTLETHVARVDQSASYQMVVLDLKRKIETRVTREDLYRIGNFTDWFDLAHGLRYPQGDYRLTMLPPNHAPKLGTSIACQWYLIEQGTASTRICWSTRERLPIAIMDSQNRVLWQIAEVSRSPLPNDVFEVRDQGYVRNDASMDISGD